MLSFLSGLIARTPPEKLIQRLMHTAYDELMIIDPARDTFENRYHTDRKFFMPVIESRYTSLLEYCSSHMVHPEDRETYFSLLNGTDMEERLSCAYPKGILSGMVRYLALDGTWREMEALLVSGLEYAIPPGTVYLYLFDIMDMRRREQGMQVETAASARRLRDLMPDLLPETAFFAMAQEKVRDAETQWCMIAIDIKHFKLFKDLNGRVKGEQLLVRFAEHIHGVAEQTGGLACYRGQDDYSLMIPFDQAVIDRLFSTLHHEIDSLSGASGFFPIFGIAMILDPDLSAMDHFNRAALTAEEIKDDIQCHMRIYDPDAHGRHVEEFKLLSGFRAGLTNGEITFHVQPQINVESGKIIGCEALTRWQRADGTFLSPAVFVPVLEKYGVITDLDTRLWEQVCAWIRNLIDSGIKPVPVSLNVSRICIFALDVPETLTALTQKYGLDTSLIKVEITESAYVEDEGQVKAAVAELRRRGFLVMMDDFGSGYSSLGMLRTVSVDVIKLDAQFLRFTIGEEQKGIHILESIINMIKSLSVPIIVEGVDSPILVHYLKDMGCRYMQGFHFYRPMPPGQFRSLIASSGNVDYRGIMPVRNEQLQIREFMDSNLYSDAMLNNILGPVVFYSLKDGSVDIIRFNSQFLRLISLEADVMEQRRYHIEDFIHPDDRQKFFGMLSAAAADHINGAEGIFRVYKPSGSIFWMHLYVYYLREENGRQMFYGSARDMTELQYLNTDLPGGYYRCAATDRFELLYTSQAFLDMLGYTREDLATLYGNEFVRLIHPDDVQMVIDSSNATALRDPVDYLPFRVRCRNGKYIYVVEQSHLTDIFGGLCWQSILVDVTEVMILRNRMRLLEKYSTDCIIFIHDITDPSAVEMAVYGLDKHLGIDPETFRSELISQRMNILDKNGNELFPALLENYDDPSVLNGVYTLVFTDKRRIRMNIRFSRIHDRSRGVECIVSFSPAAE